MVTEESDSTVPFRVSSLTRVVVITRSVVKAEVSGTSAIPVVSFARRAALVAPGLTAVGTRATIPIPRGVRDRYGMLKPLKEARDLNGPDA